MAVQRHLLDSLPLEGHEAAGERGVDAREVCLRDVYRPGLTPIKAGRESLDYCPGQRLHLHCCYPTEEIHWVWNTARSDKMANISDTNRSAERNQLKKENVLLLTESLVILQ